jgi:hypothetical protein
MGASTELAPLQSRDNENGKHFPFVVNQKVRHPIISLDAFLVPRELLGSGHSGLL